MTDTALEPADPLDMEDLEPDDPPATEDGEDGEEFAGFADEEPDPDEATPLVNTLRHKIKEQSRALREKERELEKVKAPQSEKLIEVGDEPDVDTYEYDLDRYKADVAVWKQRRKARDEQDARLSEQRRKQDDEWSGVTRAYQEKKSKLRFPDKDEAEARAFEELNVEQQALIAKVTPDPALLIYALGKSPSKLATLSAVTDPFRLCYEIGNMQRDLNTGKKKPATQPEQIVRGGTVKATTTAKAIDQIDRAVDAGKMTLTDAIKRKRAMGAYK